ncbi:MAG: hypothetical protein II910_04055 [Prevotella sp.]|nr:hypothetical protein [Prevotella sp.]
MKLLRITKRIISEPRLIPADPRVIAFAFMMVFSLVTKAQPSDYTDDIRISYQTFNIDTKAITHPFTTLSIKDVVKHHGLYFCLFIEQPIDYDFSKEYSHILVVRPGDFSFNEVDIPDSIVFSNYSQLFVRNDSILIKGYYSDERDYCITDCKLGENDKARWTLKEVQPVSTEVYKDNDYKINFTNRGEWGRYMTFVDLSDDAEYIYYGCGRVFKRTDGYYFCHDQGIDKVVNPKNGIKHKPGNDFSSDASFPEAVLTPEIQLRGPFIVFGEDTLWNAYFIHNNMIHMIQTDRDGSYLSKFDGEKAVRLKKLKKRYEHIRCSELGNSSGGNGGLYYCFPSPKSDNLNFDLIDIDNNLIKIISVVTDQSPSIVISGRDGLEETLAFVTDGFSSKTMNDVSVLESQLGSYKNTIPSHLRYKSQYDSESMTYYRFVDESTFIRAEYGYDAKTGQLNSLILEWSPLSDLICFQNKNISFSERQIREKIKSTINRVLSCKPKRKKGEYEWRKNGIKVDLWKNNLSLLIEKTQ